MKTIYIAILGLICMIICSTTLAGGMTSQNGLPFTSMAVKQQSAYESTGSSQGADPLKPITSRSVFSVIMVYDSGSGSGATNTAAYLQSVVSKLQYPDMTLESVDVRQSPSVATYHTLSVYPTVLIFKNSTLIMKIEGAKDENYYTSAIGESAAPNYIMTRKFSNYSGTEWLDEYTYADGFGREMETVQKGITPDGKDLVSITEYDNAGRISKKWLPGVSPAQGQYISVTGSVFSANSIHKFYNDTRPYSEYIYEPSPLDRVAETYGPGENWHNNNKKQSTAYLLNNDSLQCPVFSMADNSPKITVKRDGYYATGNLTIETSTDEDGNVSYTFKNQLGQTILIRKINNGENYDTYQIYDKAGNLCAVLPPEASARITANGSWSEDDDIIKNYAFLYRYDTQSYNMRNTCIGKKVPGTAWTYYVVDKYGKPVMTQDGNMRDRGQWEYNVYDNHSRLVERSIVCTSLSREQIQERYASPGFQNTYPMANGEDILIPFGDGSFSLVRHLQSTRYGDYTYIDPAPALSATNTAAAFSLSTAAADTYRLYIYGPKNMMLLMKVMPPEFGFTSRDIAAIIQKMPTTLIDGLSQADAERYCAQLVAGGVDVAVLKSSDPDPEPVPVPVPDLEFEGGKYLGILLSAAGSSSADIVAEYDPNLDYFTGNASVRSEYYIGRNSGKDFYYIPKIMKGKVDNVCAAYPAIYAITTTFYGQGTPLAGLNNSDLGGKDTITVPSHTIPNIENLEFVPVSGVVTNDDVYDWNPNLIIYEKKAILTPDSTLQQFIEQAFYYDGMGRVVQKVEKNITGGISRYSTKYDFMDNVLASHEQHSLSPGSATYDQRLTTFVLDHAGRVMSESTSVNGAPPVTLSYTYDQLGRIATRKYGEGDNAVTDTLKYNIRSWITRQSSRLFDMKLRYSDPSVYYIAPPSFSGNISQLEWQFAGGDRHSYGFSYDNLGQLTGSKAYVSSNGEWTRTNRFEETPCQPETAPATTASAWPYDRNGNILGLTRNSSGSDPTRYTYNYTGNQLSSLSVLSGNGAFNAVYAYDNNGNMTADGRKYLNFEYNYLNLVSKVYDSALRASYAWSADGQKLSVTDRNGNGYFYLGSLVFSKGGAGITLESGSFGGGRIIKSSTGYETRFHICDHLGSVRVVFTADGQVREQNNYYPFGGRWDSAAEEISDNRYRFTGKEIQTVGNVGFYDFGARMYDTGIGRWSAVDPKSENYYTSSPYVYCANNPVKFIDVDGCDYYQSVRGAVIWRNNNVGRLKVNDEIFKNIGTSYSMQMIDGSYINYYQDQAISMSPEAVDAMVTVLDNPALAGALLGKNSPLSSTSQQGLMTDMIHRAQNEFIRGSVDMSGSVLESTGNTLAVAGYAVSATGAGAGVGVAMSVVGNTMSRVGTGLQLITNLNQGNYGQAIVTSAGYLLSSGTSKLANYGAGGSELLEGRVNLFFAPMNFMIGNTKYDKKR